jgi:hypothetical protein
VVTAARWLLRYVGALAGTVPPIRAPLVRARNTPATGVRTRACRRCRGTPLTPPPDCHPPTGLPRLWAGALAIAAVEGVAYRLLSPRRRAPRWCSARPSSPRSGARASAAAAHLVGLRSPSGSTCSTAAAWCSARRRTWTHGWTSSRCAATEAIASSQSVCC